VVAKAIARVRKASPVSATLDAPGTTNQRAVEISKIGQRTRAWWTSSIGYARSAEAFGANRGLTTGNVRLSRSVKARR
jgi:hypothetical protein